MILILSNSRLHLGKTKNKNGSELEYLRGEVRRLKRQLKTLERREHFFENVINVIAEDLPGPKEVKPTCGECFKGEIVETDLGKYISEKCSTCPYKKLVKK